MPLNLDLTGIGRTPLYEEPKPDPLDSGRSLLDFFRERLESLQPKPGETGADAFIRSAKGVSQGVTDTLTGIGSEDVSRFVEENAPSVLRLARLAIKGEYGPIERSVVEDSDSPLEMTGKLLKNAALSVDDIIPALLSLPFQFMADPASTTKAIVNYAPDQFLNLINADPAGMFEHLFPNGDEEYYQKRKEARQQLYADPLGPVFAAQLVRSVMGGGKTAQTARFRAAVETDIKTAQLLLPDLGEPMLLLEYKGKQPGKPFAVLPDGTTVSEMPAKGKRVGGKSVFEVQPGKDGFAELKVDLPKGILDDVGMPGNRANTVMSRMIEELMFDKALTEGEATGAVKRHQAGTASMDPVAFERRLRLEKRFEETTGHKINLGQVENALSELMDHLRNRGDLKPPGQIQMGTFSASPQGATVLGRPVGPGKGRFRLTEQELAETEIAPLRRRFEETRRQYEELKKSALTEMWAEETMKKRNAQVMESQKEPIILNTDTEPLSWWRKMIAPAFRNAATAKTRNMGMERAGEMTFRQVLMEELSAKAKSMKFSKSDLEDMIYYRQGTENPRTGRNPKNTLSEAAKKFVDEDIGNILQEQWDRLVDAGLVDETAQIERYLDQFWAGKGATKAKWAKDIRKGRKLPSYADGINRGLTPLYNNIVDVVRVGEQMKTRAIVNSELVSGLFDMADFDGNRLIIPSKSAGADAARSAGWVEVNHPALNKIVFRKAKGSKAAVGFEQPVLVHPDFSGVVKNLFTEPFMSNVKLLRNIRAINSAAKASQLSVSLFHFGALTESAFGAIGPTGPFRFMAGLRLVQDKAFLEHALKSGLDIGASSDVGLSIINRGLRTMEARANGKPIVAQAARFLRAGKEVWDKALWEKYHRGLKLYAFHKTEAWLLKKYPEIHPRIVAQTTAEMVNNFFGGQNFEAMLANPHILESLQLAMLAPDWSLSVAKQAASPFDFKAFGKLRARLGRVSDGDLITGAGQRAQIRGALGRRYWARYAAYNYLGIQALQLFFSGMRGDPKFSWDNPDGHELDFITPGNHEDGSAMYASPGKQAKEVVRWITDLPLQLGTKSSPIIRMAGEQIFDTEAGSGYPAPWRRTTEERVTGVRPTFTEELPLRLRSASEMFLPFSFSGTNFAMTFPISAGMTRDKFRQEYSRAYKERDQKRMQDLIRSAKYNNLNGWRDIIKQVESRQKALKTIESRRR